jgi:hypothetical protein
MNKSFRDTPPATPPKGLSVAIGAIGGPILPMAYASLAALLLFISYGVLRGDIRLGIIVGLATAVILFAINYRTTLTIGPGWLKLQKLIGSSTIDPTSLVEIKRDRSTSGTYFRLKDSHGHSVSVQRSLLMSSDILWAEFERSLSISKKAGLNIDSRTLSALNRDAKLY